MEKMKTLEINLISARDIKDLNLISKMDVYAVVLIAGGNNTNQQQKVKSPVDRAGGSNPTWNCPFSFTVQEALAQQNRLTLVVKLRCVAALGDKDIGEVNVPVKELMDDFLAFRGGKGEVDGGDHGRTMRFLSYQVRKPSGRPKGQLNFSYRFTDFVGASPNPINDKPATTTYPAPVAAPSSASASAPSYFYDIPQPQPQPQAASYSYDYGYPPPPAAQAYPYIYPPPPSAPVYGYPQPPLQYGYPPAGGYLYPPSAVQQPQPPRRKNSGMGLGTGILGGVLGGLLIGDLVSDSGF